MKNFRSFTKEMKKRLTTDVKGFTLMEVIVVLVILAILMAIAIPNVLGYINKAKDTETEMTARNIYMAANVQAAEVLKTERVLVANNAEDNSKGLSSDANKNEIINLSSFQGAELKVEDWKNDTDPIAYKADTATVIVKNGTVAAVVYYPKDAAGLGVTYYANGKIKKASKAGEGMKFDSNLLEVTTAAKG